MSPRWAPAADRLWARVEKVGPDQCWPWTAGRDVDGYGVIRVDKRRLSAHRLAYELTIGAVPEGLVLDHRCHTDDATCPGGIACAHRRCCNPSHLEPVTNAENVRRGLSPSALAARTDTCPEGHQLTGSPGNRYCPDCRRTQGREGLRRRRAGLDHLPPCSAEGCTSTSYVRGMCNAHYLRSRKIKSANESGERAS